MTDNEWELINLDLEENADTLTEISKTHWKQGDSRSTCYNGECKKKFSLLERKHHCRRCGEVFCDTCVQYRRRLSFLAHYDPGGKLYKVCKTCFDEGGNIEIYTHSLTKFYNDMKQDKQRRDDHLGQTSLSKSCRDSLDLDKECLRLKKGFVESVGSSEMKRTLQEMKVLISTPNWQKSFTWMVCRMDPGSGTWGKY
ncbi:hypothetical protein ACF0H5_024291 [Mactra antiquata]